MLITSSRTEERVSNALTIAPRLCAQPIAERPATPAPITSTLAGGNFPCCRYLSSKKTTEIMGCFSNSPVTRNISHGA